MARYGRLGERRSPAAGEPIIESGGKRKVFVRYKRTPNRWEQSARRRGATRMKRMMPKLSNEAVVGRILSVFMKKMMKVRRKLQRTDAQPKREHHRNGSETAIVPPMLCCREKLHASVQHSTAAIPVQPRNGASPHRAIRALALCNATRVRHVSGIGCSAPRQVRGGFRPEAKPGLRAVAE